jgi:hypothetical protein
VIFHPHAGRHAGQAAAGREIMRANRLWLMAVVPGLWNAGASARAPMPCRIAIELHVKAPLVLGTLELNVMAGEVEHVWSPCGVSFCWTRAGEACDGLEVRLRVHVAPTASLPATAPPGKDVLGWIPFFGERPGTDIVLSDAAARSLVAKARVGLRPLAAWPPVLREQYVPRVLGRGLAHEIGLFVLASRDHTRTGLMAPSFSPDRAGQPVIAGAALGRDPQQGGLRRTASGAGGRRPP